MKKITKPPSDESIASVTRRLETLELESYMQAFSEFMESPMAIDHESEINNFSSLVVRRWRRLSNHDKLGTFAHVLLLAKFLSLHATVDFRKAVREFSAAIYEAREDLPAAIRPRAISSIDNN